LEYASAHHLNSRGSGKSRKDQNYHERHRMDRPARVVARKESHMTRDDIIRWARQAGIKLPDGAFPDQGSFTLPNLIQFAALVAAAERNRMISDGWRQCARGQPDPKITHLNAWARDRLARHGIPMPGDDDGNPSF
jgi:hypothetical protein